MLSCGLTGLTRISFEAASPQILADLDCDPHTACNQLTSALGDDENWGFSWQPPSHTDDL